MQLGVDHVSRYFSGSSRVVERDHQDRDLVVQLYGTQAADGAVTRRIMVLDGNTEAAELSGAYARALARALIAAADEAEQMNGYDVGDRS